MLRFGLVVCCVVLVGCGGGRGRTIGGGDAGAGAMCPATGSTRILCSSGVAITCDGEGNETQRRNCASEGLSCFPSFGCGVCRPRSGSCEGNTPRTCREDGSGWENGTPCDEGSGLNCDSDTGTCRDLCMAAAESQSYIGCEYWPTTTTNPVANEFEFAVVVANPHGAASAQVTVTRAGATVSSVNVPPGGLETIRLPWIYALKNPVQTRPGMAGETINRSVLVRGGAYRLTSTIPVTVYQFNPLEYRIGRDCVDEVGGVPTDGQCFSFSNDASLLLPTHVLTGNYIVVARESQQQRVRLRDDRTGEIVTDPMTGEVLEVYQGGPGYVAIVGAEDRAVDVQVTFSSHVEASTDGVVSQHTPGSTANFSLGAGDVLQLLSATPPGGTCTGGGPADEVAADCGTAGAPIPCTYIFDYCAVPREYDLTGTEIRAAGKVAVIGGHQCTFVPFNRWACDHLEEAMFPLESWGKDFVVSATQPLRSEPNVVRLVSGADGNTITFEPPVQGAATLNRGDILEFETGQDFRVTGTEALIVAQLLVGQDYAGYGSSGAMGLGDPSLSLAIPTEQYRDSYTFLAPASFAMSFVNVTAPVGQDVLLDGTPVTGFVAIGATSMQTARVPIGGGTHTITSTDDFGIVVYGFGSYTSYMVPGGLDFEAINSPF